MKDYNIPNPKLWFIFKLIYYINYIDFDNNEMKLKKHIKYQIIWQHPDRGLI